MELLSLGLGHARIHFALNVFIFGAKEHLFVLFVNSNSLKFSLSGSLALMVRTVMKIIGNSNMMRMITKLYKRNQLSKKSKNGNQERLTTWQILPMFAMVADLMIMITNCLFATNVTTRFVIGIAINNLGQKIVLLKKKKIFIANFVSKMIQIFISVTKKRKK